MGQTAPDAEPRRQSVSDMRADSREAQRWKSEAHTALREVERLRTLLEENKRLQESAKAPTGSLKTILRDSDGNITKIVDEPVTLREEEKLDA